MKPFIKWVGGKTQLIPSILPLIPDDFGTYYEPFLGGGALFFTLRSAREKFRACLNDLNTDLINTYRVVRDSPQGLIDLLTEWKKDYMRNPEPFFYEIRANEKKGLRTDEEMAARFIFLNKTAFNGLYRVNKKGGFNAPWGKYENPPICDSDNILACSEALGNAHLYSGQYRYVLDNTTYSDGVYLGGSMCVTAGDVVYFDPPYVPLNPTSNFTAYTSEGFGLQQQKELAETFKMVASTGACVILSNSDTPIVRELYKDFEILTVSARRNINSKGDARGKINEVLVCCRSKT